MAGPHTANAPRATAADRAGRRSAPVPGSRLTGAPRRRRRPAYLLLGVVLVVGCAAAGLVAGTRIGQRQSVLVLARPVTVGQVLAAADLRSARVSADGLDSVPVGAEGSVVGRPVAYSLPAGTLVSRALVGAAQVPPMGKAIGAVALKDGQFPTGLTAGSRVAVVVAPSTTAAAPVPTSSGADETPSWAATVVAVHPEGASEQTTVVSLLMAEADARALAAAPAGQVGLVTINGAG